MARLSRRLWGGRSLKTAAKEAILSHTLRGSEVAVRFTKRYFFLLIAFLSRFLAAKNILWHPRYT